MLVEIVFKVGNKGPDPTIHWQDGQPVAWGPADESLWVSPADFHAWLWTEANPPGFDALPRAAQDKHLAFVDRCRQGQEPDALAKVMVNGYHTLWGSGDMLKEFGVIRADLTRAECELIMASPRDPLTKEPLMKRAVRVPYDSLLTKAEVRDLKTAGKYVKPYNKGALTKGQVTVPMTTGLTDR